MPKIRRNQVLDQPRHGTVSDTELAKFENQLEKVIDTVGLPSAVWLLRNVAIEKSAHIEDVWQDEPLARVWRKAAGILETTAQRLANL